MEEWDDKVGLSNLNLFHLNDSKKGLGERVDRHAQIGNGDIGLEGFRLLVNDSRFASVPGILETPPLESGENSYQANLGILRGLLEEER